MNDHENFAMSVNKTLREAFDELVARMVLESFFRKLLT